MTIDLSEKVLRYIDTRGQLDTLALSIEWNEDHQKLVGITKSLQSLGDIIKVEQKSDIIWQLTREGESIASNGSHEALVYYCVPEDGIILNDLMVSVGANGKVGFSKAMSLGWIQLNKVEQKVYRKVSNITDHVKECLLLVKENNGMSLSPEDKIDLKKRKLLQEITIKSYVISKGPSFTLQPKKLEADLTPEMIITGSWKDREFKPYNFDAKGVDIQRGHLHPLMKVKSEFRQIFLEMGFTEMPTNRYVESSFWNFDSLFQPQQHPARDMQDTFFVSDPSKTTEFPADYLDKVKKVHSHGGYGSTGYQYDWKIEEAQKNLLRTHTTSVSARLLYQLALQKKFTPVKYFSIDKVFRNETLDATHLAEFHQIEGVIADYNLTLGDLMGTLHSFFSKLGLTKLKFKPAYNPYTEPSMEIFSYHPGLGKWVEVGNSGMFRPEMLRPMGLSPDVRVIAWGLSLERPTMIKYGISNIRDLVGHKVDLCMVMNNPICRLNKPQGTSPALSALEKRQAAVLSQLENLYMQVLDLKSLWKGQIVKGSSNSAPLDLTVFANPKSPPYSLPVLLNWLSHTHQVNSKIFVHSSVSQPLPNALLNFLSKPLVNASCDDPLLSISLIWKEVSHVELYISPMSPPLVQESTVIRYLSRLAAYGWGKESTLEDTLLDQLLDKIDSFLLHGNEEERKKLIEELELTSSGDGYLIGSEFTVADLLLWSTLKHHNLFSNLPSKLNYWLGSCLSRQDLQVLVHV